MKTVHPHISLPVLAGLTLAVAPSPAAEVIANFNTTAQTAAWPGGLYSSTGLGANTADPFTFRYDISGLGIGTADELLITVDTVGSSANFNTGGGNGIAVVGGTSNNWWEETDGALSFTIVIEDAGNADITGSFEIDLIGASIRWGDTDPASVTLSVAGAGPFSLTTLNQGVDLPTGETAETSFTASRTGDTIGQFQQLRFNISSGPDTTGPAITATNPADDASGVPVSANLVATFNEDIALTGNGTVTIRDLGPGPDVVIGLPDTQVSLSGTRDLVINPTADLLPNNGYAVRISADAIRDQAPIQNVFAGILDDATWDFSTGGTPPDGPNVIVYLLDDLGLTDVQEHATYFPDGSPLFETPNMHRLASEGMRFNHAYAQPLCSASRFSLLSGQDAAARHGLYMAITRNGSVPNPGLPATSAASQAYNYPTDRDHMPLAVETIAERLKAAGYVTWHAGKWHLSPNSGGSNPNPVTTFYPDKQGFDKQLSVGGAGPSSYFGPFNGIPNMVDYNGNPANGSTGDHLPDHMAGLVQDMIDDHLATDPDRPFFLYYPAYSVHGPHETKKSLFNYYQTKLAGLPGSKHKHPVMAGQVHSADDELGQMLDYLDTTLMPDSTPLADNTLLIFVSDNGGLSITYQSGSIFDDIGADGIPDDDPANTVNGNYAKTTAPIPSSTRMSEMAPRRAGKGALYEGGVRIPMIVRYPDGGIAAGSASNEAVHLADIYQTILDYTPAVAKAGYELDGETLKPLLEQTGSLPDRDIFIHFPRSSTTWGTRFLTPGYPGADYPFNVYPGGTAVINYPFKLIARYSTAHDAATVNYELFRLDLDVGEDTNVAGEHPEVVDAMRKRLEAYYTDTGALVPTPNPSYNGTSVNLPETTAEAYLTDAGLTPGTPQSFLLADPDLDGRRNEDEFLEQTDPSTSDGGLSTIWLSDNGSFDELRFAIPANVDQAAFRVLDSNGSEAFTPASGLVLDGQYGPFYVYRPTSPQAGEDPGDYRISLTPPAPGPSTTPDTDGDLLPDAHESSNGLNPNDPADGNTDNDGDGFTRGQEYLAGTNDFDRNDRFNLSINGQGPLSPSINFDAKDQKAYRLHKSRDLNSWTLWEDFGVVTGNHDVALPLTPDLAREFYKIEAYLP